MSSWVGRAAPGFHRCGEEHVSSWLPCPRQVFVYLPKDLLPTTATKKYIRAGLAQKPLREKSDAGHIKNYQKARFVLQPPDASNLFILCPPNITAICASRVPFQCQGWDYAIYSAGRGVHLCNLANTVPKPVQPALSLHITMPYHVSGLNCVVGGRQLFWSARKISIKLASIQIADKTSIFAILFQTSFHQSIESIPARLIDVKPISVWNLSPWNRPL